MVNLGLAFNQTAITSASTLFKDKTATSKLPKIINLAYDIVKDVLPMPSDAIKGFLLGAAQKWEDEHKVDLNSLDEKSESATILVLHKLMDHFVDDLVRALVNPMIVDQLREEVKLSLTRYLTHKISD